jgi:hypothetical protein
VGFQDHAYQGEGQGDGGNQVLHETEPIMKVSIYNASVNIVATIKMDLYKKFREARMANTEIELKDLGYDGKYIITALDAMSWNPEEDTMMCSMEVSQVGFSTIEVEGF